MLAILGKDLLVMPLKMNNCDGMKMEIAKIKDWEKDI
jgi:hypothetical protein